MLQNIDIAEFTAEVKCRRQQALDLVTNERLVDSYRHALSIVCHEDEWRIKAPVSLETAIPTEQDHRAALSIASRKVPEYARPTAKQLDYLAALMANAGEHTTYDSPLGKKAASGLISDYLS